MGQKSGPGVLDVDRRGVCYLAIPDLPRLLDDEVNSLGLLGFQIVFRKLAVGANEREHLRRLMLQALLAEGRFSADVN